jgi:hypothetical protein
MFNFRKISAITSSVLMIGMTLGVAAAANYPAPFVANGAGDVAIVYGTGSGVSILDAVEAGSIQANLQSFMGGSTSAGTGAVSGESAALFTGGTKLYINDPLNNVKSTLTKSDLPTALADQTFSGDVDAKVTQTITIGSSPRLVYKAQPSSSDDPQFGLNFSSGTSSGTAELMNMTATFDKAVNFTSSDSQGQVLNLFGNVYTVSSDTSTTNGLVLLKSSQQVDLTKDTSSASATGGTPTASVTVSGKQYTVELVSGSDTAATIKVTDSSGSSETKEVTEASSKQIDGITIGVITATQAGNIVTATVIAGADKVTFLSGGAVTTGSNNNVVDGTYVSFGGGGGVTNMTSITVSIRAPDSDHDVILPGTSYVDPAFGELKLDFPGLNIAEISTARENITVQNSGSDKMEASFTTYDGHAITQVFAVNSTVPATGFGGYVDDSNFYNLTVREGKILHAGDYVVVGNEDDGHLLKLESTANSSTAGTNNDRARFTDVATGDTLDTTWTSEGTGTLTVGGKSYTVKMYGDANNASEGRDVYLNYPDSSTAGQEVIFPTIQTSKGAKLAFYSPQLINLTDAQGNILLRQGVSPTNVTGLLFPDGDGYTTVGVTIGGDGGNSTVYFGSSSVNTSATDRGSSTVLNVGELNYNVSSTGLTNQVRVYLMQPGGAEMLNPGLIVLEEKDDNSLYNAMVVSLENASAGVGVSASTTGIADTWNNASASNLHSNNKIYKKADLWGSIMTVDTGASDQYIASISYPDEQVYGQFYVGAVGSSVSASTVSGGSAQLGDVLVKDSEVSSVSSKNLVVVGGSCINAVAAKLIGGGKCTADWQTATGVGSGQYLIQSFGDAYTTGKVALLVAGYDAADTVNAAKYLETQTVTTDAGTKYIGTSSTSATLQTTKTA